MIDYLAIAKNALVEAGGDVSERYSAMWQRDVNNYVLVSIADSLARIAAALEASNYAAEAEANPYRRSE